jgi:hypothetical protein
MTSSLDRLLAEEPRRNDAALDRTLSAVRAELALKRPVRRWRTEVVWVIAASAGLGTAVALVLMAFGQLSVSFLLGRAPFLALLAVTSAVCAWGALSPRGRWLRVWGVGLSLASAVALVLARVPVHAEPTLPGWVCTASHVGVGSIPLIVAVLFLRGAVFQPLRALVAGLSAGTTGAFLGELACGQGWRHVAGYHVSAWAIVAVAALVMSKSLEPRSFAP